MRWTVPKVPRLDDVRERTVFAWLPTRLDDDTMIWLDAYLVRERYAWDARPGFAPSWVPVARLAIDGPYRPAP